MQTITTALTFLREGGGRERRNLRSVKVLYSMYELDFTILCFAMLYGQILTPDCRKCPQFMHSPPKGPIVKAGFRGILQQDLILF